MVINTLRPFTSDVQGIAQMASDLQEAARMKIDGYINNTNLLEHTTFEEVAEGEKIIAEAARLTEIPLLATTIMKGVATPEQLASLTAPEVIELERKIHYNY